MSFSQYDSLFQSFLLPWNVTAYCIEHISMNAQTFFHRKIFLFRDLFKQDHFENIFVSSLSIKMFQYNPVVKIDLKLKLYNNWGLWLKTCQVIDGLYSGVEEVPGRRRTNPDNPGGKNKICLIYYSRTVIGKMFASRSTGGLSHKSIIFLLDVV